MLKFLIESRRLKSGDLIPAQDFGYTALDAVEYQNWFEGTQVYSYTLLEGCRFQSRDLSRFLCPDCIPVGSVEFCLAWYRGMGLPDIRPLNLPPELWKFAGREIFVSDGLPGGSGQYFVKDMEEFKAPGNGMASGGRAFPKPMLCSAWIDGIVSEWRAFVLDGEVQGIRCYGGDEWILPSRELILEIAQEYANRSYTLDVMVDGAGKTYPVEVHDFFACGLYGFDDPPALLRMLYRTQRKLLSPLKLA